MSHQLNYNSRTDKHSFFSVKEKAWHGLGTIVESYPSSAEALKFAGLDYNVEKRPLFTVDSRNLVTFQSKDAGGLNDVFMPDIPVPNIIQRLGRIPRRCSGWSVKTIKWCKIQRRLLFLMVS